MPGDDGRGSSRGRPPRALLALVALLALASSAVASGIRSSPTYRPEVVGSTGVVATGRHFGAQAAMQMLLRGGNAIDAGVAAVFAAAVTEISHFGLGGEVPIIIHLGERNQTVVVNGQGTAPAATSLAAFRQAGEIPTNGPSAGTVPAVVDALALALSEYGTLTLSDVLGPAIALADGFPWYGFLTEYLGREREAVERIPSGARVYLPGGAIPSVGATFRQPELAATLRALTLAERQAAPLGRKAAIAAARDVFYRGDVARRMARAVRDAGGLLTEADLASYRGALESPTRGMFRTRHGSFEIMKTGFWGQGPLLLQALAILRGFDLERMGHNSAEYIHIVTEALKLALADRDTHYGDPAFANIPGAALLSDSYAAARRALIDPRAASLIPRPGDPSRLERGAPAPPRGAQSGPGRTAPTPAARRESPDTTTVNVADARGNLFSASPSSAWFSGGVFIAGDTGVPLGNRMQAFVLLEDGHPNLIGPGKRPRTTLSPTVILRDGRPWIAMSSPGGDSQDQQALQVFLNLAVFGMGPQEAIEAPRFNSLHHHESFRTHRFHAGVLDVEDRIPPEVMEALRQRGHKVRAIGAFMMDTGTALVGVNPLHGTLFAAADVRRQRFATGF